MSQPAYLIAQLDVKDFQQYRDQYVKPVFARPTQRNGNLIPIRYRS